MVGSGSGVSLGGNRDPEGVGAGLLVSVAWVRWAAAALTPARSLKGEVERAAAGWSGGTRKGGEIPPFDKLRAGSRLRGAALGRTAGVTGGTVSRQPEPLEGVRAGERQFGRIFLRGGDEWRAEGQRGEGREVRPEGDEEGGG